ncbi:hypothetical protein BGZ83_012025 [Gryganskiella cystojenkinii]|nr:hypothetical protein BGZ83_012025 [Gryganskiella cystojenkinii]
MRAIATMLSIDCLPAEILADIFLYDGLADIARQTCMRWRAIALPLWLRRLSLRPSDPFNDRGMLAYLQSLSEHDRLFVRGLDVTSRRDFDSSSNNVVYTDVADVACVNNVLMIQSLLGERIHDLALTDTGWAPESLIDLVHMALMTTHHLVHFQISLFKVESFLLSDLMTCLTQLYDRDSSHLKSLALDLAQPVETEQWDAMAGCTELQDFHLGLYRSSEPILTDILVRILPQWHSLSSLYLCQPRFLTADTVRCLYRDLPRPEGLHELHLIFEACQASQYEDEFLKMIRAMPNLRTLEAHLDWTDRMMDQVASTLKDLRKLTITCSSVEFTCCGIREVVWGQGLEKVNMRTSGKIWRGFIDAVRKRSRRVKILVYGSMKWGGSIDEWE